MNNKFTESVFRTSGDQRSYLISTYTDPSGNKVPLYILTKAEGPPGTAGTSYNYEAVFSDGGTGYDAIKSISDISGTWSYNFDYSSSSAGSKWTITRKSPEQFVKSFVTGIPGLIYNTMKSVENELSETTNYIYDPYTLLTHVVPPEGTVSGATPVSGYIQHTYDARGNVTIVTKVPKAGSALINIIYTAGYDATCASRAKCNKPNWVRDANGNQIDFTYDANHGGILSEMRPAPSAGAARPLTLTTWVQIYGWAKNASGALVQSAYPIWRMAGKTECQTTPGSNASTCDPGAPQTLTTFQYGAPATRYALLVKGMAVSSGGTTLRTCYDYDIYGNRISETAPRAGLGVCP